MPDYTHDPRYKPFTRLVGLRVLAYRRARKRTRETIAYMTGCTPYFIRLVESGKKGLSLKTAVLLAIALRVSLTDLVGDPLEKLSRPKKSRNHFMTTDDRVYRKGTGRTAVYNRLAKARGYSLPRGENLKAINEARRLEKLSPGNSQKIVISESQANGIRIPPVKRRKRKTARRVPPKAVGVAQ